MMERLNILLCVIESARADFLSCAGHPRPTTPFLDQMAREGVRFPNMITNAPSSLPALASLLTGKPVVAHGAHEENPRIEAGHKRLPEILKTAGYRTAAFCTAPELGPEAGLAQGFDVYATQRYASRVATRIAGLGRAAVDRVLRRTDAGARRSNRQLLRWLTASPGPFFALVHYAETRFGADLPPPFDRMFLPRGIQPLVARNSIRAAVAPDSKQHDVVSLQPVLRSRYEGALRYIDQRLGEVAVALQQRGEWDRTLLVVTADHGVALGDNGRVGSGVGLDDALLRVPLLLRCPGLVPAGFVVDDMAQSSDVMPTILSLAGIRAAQDPTHGRALLASGRAVAGPGFAVAERFRAAGGVRSKAIRTLREKLIWRSDEANEFYDLGRDPSETENRIESEVQRADELRRQLFDWLAAVQSSEPRESNPQPVADAAPQMVLQGA